MKLDLISHAAAVSETNIVHSFTKTELVSTEAPVNTFHPTPSLIMIWSSSLKLIVCLSASSFRHSSAFCHFLLYWHFPGNKFDQDDDRKKRHSKNLHVNQTGRFGVTVLIKHKHNGHTCDLCNFWDSWIQVYTRACNLGTIRAPYVTSIIGSLCLYFAVCFTLFFIL